MMTIHSPGNYGKIESYFIQSWIYRVLRICLLTYNNLIDAAKESKFYLPFFNIYNKLNHFFRNSTIYAALLKKESDIDIPNNSYILALITNNQIIRFLFTNKSVIILTGILLLISLIFFLGPVAGTIISLLFFLLTVISFRLPHISLVMLLISFGICPKIYLPTLPYYFYLRLDDIIIVSLLLVCLQRLAKGTLQLRKTSLDLPIMLFLAIIIISACQGMLIGGINNPIRSLLYFAKIIEYILAFFFTVNLLENKNQAHLLIKSLIIAGIFLSLMGMFEWFFSSLRKSMIEESYIMNRIFDNGIFQDEANHIAGFIMIAVVLLLSRALHSTNPLKIVIFITGVLFLFLIQLLTLSRTAFIGLIGAILIIGLLTKKRILLPILFIFLILWLLAPAFIRERTNDFFNEYHIFKFVQTQTDVGYQSYFRTRLANWSIILDEYRRFPILGVGLGARERFLYENQYLFVLSEVGIIGFLVFLWLLLRMGKFILKNTSLSECKDEQGWRIGIFAVFCGILVMGLASISLVIIRIAGPFWMLLGAWQYLSKNAMEDKVGQSKISC